MQTSAMGWANVTWGLTRRSKNEKNKGEADITPKNAAVKSKEATKLSEGTDVSLTTSGAASNSPQQPSGQGSEASCVTSIQKVPTQPDNASETAPLKSALSNPDRASRGLKPLGRTVAQSQVAGTIAVSQGLHNLPRLYGDTTVRTQDKVTGIQSGLRAAGRAPVLGIFDGISGLVTQPMQGAKEEGAVGFMKGVGKGFGGLLIKPIAGVHGIMGNISKGVWKEARRRGECPIITSYYRYLTIFGKEKQTLISSHRS